MKNVKILICTGHTGGHFFPAFSFAGAFKKTYPEAEVHFLLNRQTDFASRVLSSCGFNLHVIKIFPPPRIFSLKMVLFLLRYAIVFVQTFQLLLTLRPAIVVGFGSYGSFCGVVGAALLKIPVLLHEQNFVSGRANELLSHLARKIAVSFPDTQGRIPPDKIVWTGYPLRDDFLQMQRQPLALTSKKDAKILIFGGSQGAKRLNEFFLAACRKLKAEEKISFAVIHIAGNNDLNKAQDFYQHFQIPAEVSTFCDDMARVYSEADLVIGRAGAGTIFELIATNRPSILIPYPFAYGHQKLNADFLAKQDAACVIEEKDLSADLLAKTITELLANPNRLLAMKSQLSRLNKKDANEHLVQLAWELTCAKN